MNNPQASTSKDNANPIVYSQGRAALDAEAEASSNGASGSGSGSGNARSNLYGGGGFDEESTAAALGLGDEEEWWRDGLALGGASGSRAGAGSSRGGERGKASWWDELDDAQEQPSGDAMQLDDASHPDAVNGQEQGQGQKQKRTARTAEEQEEIDNQEIFGEHCSELLSTSTMTLGLLAHISTSSQPSLLNSIPQFNSNDLTHNNRSLAISTQLIHP